MNGAHLHLVVNHLAVLGGILGLAALAHGLATRQQPTLRFGLIVLTVAGLAAAAAYLSGESAEEVVEHLPDVPGALIEEHEDAALFSLIGAAGLGILSLGALFRFRRREVTRGAALFILMIALGVSALLGFTAYQGGKINHPEIRTGPASAASGVDEDDHG